MSYRPDDRPRRMPTPTTPPAERPYSAFLPTSLFLPGPYALPPISHIRSTSGSNDDESSSSSGGTVPHPFESRQIPATPFPPTSPPRSFPRRTSYLPRLHQSASGDLVFAYGRSPAGPGATAPDPPAAHTPPEPPVYPLFARHFRPSEDRHGNSGDRLPRAGTLDLIFYLSHDRHGIRNLHVMPPPRPPPPVQSAPLQPPPPTQPTPDDARRAKRRKLDSDPLSSERHKGFSYGRYGQVEPGLLKMEIESCDGGIYSHNGPYAAENILKDDAAVYCTKGSRCNIILKHGGETVFSLQELIIKAPVNSMYSSPVREGMVFVSMLSDDRLSRTAKYRIECVPRNEALGVDDSALHPANFPFRQRRMGTYFHPEDFEAAVDYMIPVLPTEFTRTLTTARVTTENSCETGDSVNDSGQAAAAARNPPNRIGSLPFEELESSSNESDDLAMALSVHRARYRRTDHADARRSRRTARAQRTNPTADAQGLAATATPLSETATAAAAAATTARDGSRPVPLVTPHARFHIERKNSQCTIRFDPPVAGRFVLLKLWNANDNEEMANIDIRSVIVKGFAGSRSFPIEELQ